MKIKSKLKKINNVVLIIIFLFGYSCATQNDYAVKTVKDVMIPMRDGVELATNISRPDNNSKYPVILMRTPYGKDNEEDEFSEFIVGMEYVLVFQDCRGTGKSNGEWIPGKNEKSDGIDTHEWILKQPWCDGKIGSFGDSYLGYTQLASAMGEKNSPLVMVAGIPLLDWYSTAYCDGAFNLLTSMGWGAEMADPKLGEGAIIEGLEMIFESLPLIEWDENNLGIELPWMRNWIKNPVYNEYWKNLSDMDEIKKKLNAPLIIKSGWYDLFSYQAVDYTADAISRNKKNQHLIMGPGGHGLSTLPGGLELEENVVEEINAIDFIWLEYWLTNSVEEKPDIAPIKLFVMGKNYWRNEYEWPLERTRYVNYYFSSNGNANTLYGDGLLSSTLPESNQLDNFVYDPKNPVPTRGGAILAEDVGPFDHSDIEQREDILVYTSEALNDDIEVTGNIKVVLFASTDVKNTDWTAKLLDVYPDGKAYNLCDGIIRASYNKDPLNPQNIEPGIIYKYEIDLWATANVFQKKHKIRVEISSSNFPRFDRNPNTGNEFGMDSKLKIANQTVYHGAKYPSHIILPIIPN